MVVVGFSGSLAMFLPNVSPVCALVQFVWELSICGCEISFCPFQEMGDYSDQCVFVVGDKAEMICHCD